MIDDNVDEIEQNFALVAQLGDDVPDNFTCFQTQVGDTECLGRKGATEIKILDNDRKFLIALTIANGQFILWCTQKYNA